MDKIKSRKEILIKIHDELLESQIRNEIDSSYYKSLDRFVNTADAKRQARDNRDKSIENIANCKRTIAIIDDLLNKES